MTALVSIIRHGRRVAKQLGPRRRVINKHFEEFSEAAQVEIYRTASLQLNIVKLRLRFHSYQIK